MSAKDGAGATVSASVIVSVTDVNEAPACSSYSFSVNENLAKGTVVGNLIGSDVDENQELSWHISAVTPSERGADGSNLCFSTHPYPYFGAAITGGYCCKTYVQPSSGTCPGHAFKKCLAEPCSEWVSPFAIQSNGAKKGQLVVNHNTTLNYEMYTKFTLAIYVKDNSSTPHKVK